MKMKMNNGRILVVPFFIPHAGCPHQCAFCNQRTISGKKQFLETDENSLEKAVQLYMDYSGRNYEKIQIAFYGGNFLGLSEKTMLNFLEQANELHSRGIISSIRFSTRPDTINSEKLSAIKKYPVSTIEIGAQSMDSDVLVLANRGHTVKDTVKAAILCKKAGYETGIQMMVGLPGEDYDSCRRTGMEIAALCPDFVRIYPTLVVEGSQLAESFKKGLYSPPNLDEAVKRAKNLYLVFREKNIRVVRMGLQATEDLVPGSTVLAGPYHPAFGHLVLSAIWFDRIKKRLENQFCHIKFPDNALTIFCNARDISRIRGIKNENIHKLKNDIKLKTISVSSDLALKEGEYRLKLH